MRTLGRYVLGTLLVVVLTVVGVAFHVLRVGQTSGTPGRADAVIVLGAAEYDGRPSTVYAARLDHGADLYRQGIAPRVIAVGGRLAGDTYTEGSAGRAYLGAHGVPSSALESVDVGNDTLVSLRATATLLAGRGWNRVVLVTDPWHCARAERMAEDLGLTVTVSPVTSGPAVQSAVRDRYIWRETLGLGFYLLVGGSSGAGSPVL